MAGAESESVAQRGIRFPPILVPLYADFKYSRESQVTRLLASPPLDTADITNIAHLLIQHGRQQQR